MPWRRLASGMGMEATTYPDSARRKTENEPGTPALSS